MFQILPKTTARGVVIEHSPSTCLLTQQETALELCTCDQAKCGRNIIYLCLLRHKNKQTNKLCIAHQPHFFFLALCPEIQPHPLKGCLFNQRDTHSWLVQTRHKRHRSNLFWLISREQTFRGQLYGGRRRVSCWRVSNVMAAAKSLQSCPILCDPIDGSPPGFPVPGILQARTLEWVAISFSNA